MTSQAREALLQRLLRLEPDGAPAATVDLITRVVEHIADAGRVETVDLLVLAARLRLATRDAERAARGQEVSP